MQPYRIPDVNADPNELSRGNSSKGKPTKKKQTQTGWCPLLTFGVYSMNINHYIMHSLSNLIELFYLDWQI